MQTDGDQTLILPWGETGDTETLQLSWSQRSPCTIPPQGSHACPPQDLRSQYLSPET